MQLTLGGWLIQIAIVVSIVMYATIYLVGIKKGTVKPVLATWLFFSFATVLSFITNFAESGVRGILVNSFNLIDTFAVLVIFIVLLFTKDIRKTFNKFELVCLALVVCVFIFWLVSGANILAHLAVQVILVIAYLPTLVHIWKEKKNTESLSMWTFDFLASAFGAIEPLKSKALLPIVYSLRSVVATFAVVVSVAYIRFMNDPRYQKYLTWRS